MQLVVSGNRILAHGVGFLAMGGTVINTNTGKAYQNATVVECDNCPSDIGSVGYEYHAGHFVPCAPYGKGKGNLAVLCDGDCKAIKDSGWHMTDLLSPTTAEQYGMGEKAVPNDLFSQLSPLARYHWKRRTVLLANTPCPYPEESELHIFSKGQNITPTAVEYYENLEVDEDGNLVGVNPQSAPLSNSTSTLKATADLITGKYILVDSAYCYVADYRCGSGTSDSSGTESWLYVTVNQMFVLPANQYGDTWEEVSSPDPNAYKEGIADDGYQYFAYGRGIDNAAFPTLRVATGSYVGNGSKGKDNPNVVDFGVIEPIFVLLSGKWYASGNTVKDTTQILTPRTTVLNVGSVDFTINITANGTTWEMWSSATTLSEAKRYYGAQQANVANETYTWIAIGY